MIQTSSAYVIVNPGGYRFSFDGVTSIAHSLNLKIDTDAESGSDTDAVNGARNEPDTVTLSVVASDAHVPVSGWARQTLVSLAQIKRQRLKCKVVTSLRTYSNMLLTGISVLQDETCPDGWTGTLTFTKASGAGASASTDVQSSVPRATGSSSVRSIGAGDGSVLQTILREAGIG